MESFFFSCSFPSLFLIILIFCFELGGIRSFSFVDVLNDVTIIFCQLILIVIYSCNFLSYFLQPEIAQTVDEEISEEIRRLEAKYDEQVCICSDGITILLTTFLLFYYPPLPAFGMHTRHMVCCVDTTGFQDESDR